MKKIYCVACEIEDRKVEATEVVDKLPLCFKHATLYHKELEPIIKK
jgi:hypothetical protein